MIINIIIMNEKRGWQVKVIYTLDLFLSFDKVIHDIVKEDE